MRTVSLTLLVHAAACALGAAPAAAQFGPDALVEIPRLTGEIALDGRVDDAGWQDVPRLQGVMQTPEFGAEPSEFTAFRVAYDDAFLYVACDFRDADPAGIQASSLKRDDPATTNDWCALVLDTFDDDENALFFGTTPAGIRADAAVPNDASNAQNTLQLSWNTFWDAASHRDDNGWTAEIRVPLSSLRFQTDGGRVRMGMTLFRFIARKFESITWPAIEPRWGFYSAFKASQARDVALAGVRPTRPLYLAPYVLGGYGSERLLDGQPERWETQGSTVREFGFDLKHALGSNLTLDLTVNTDFAQVEADDQQINLTRFSLFFPEKRQFFQERASIFDFSLGGREQLFYSRRIGLVDGEPVRLYGGARVVGRIGGWDVGLLDMQTAAGVDVDPAAGVGSENFGVLRMRRRVLNENSYVGGIFTSRLGRDGAHNLLYGLDGIVRVSGQDYLTVGFAQSFDGTEPAGVAAFDRSLLRAFWERRGVDRLSYALDLARFGEEFRPDMGFVLRTGVTRLLPSIGWGIRAGPASPVLVHHLALDGTAYRRHDSGRVESAELKPSWGLEMKSGKRLDLSLTASYEDVAAEFLLPEDTPVPAGAYAFVWGRASYRARGDLLSAGLDLEGGRFFDGWRVSPRVSPTWKPSPHFELGGAYGFDRVSFPDRDRGFTAHVARLRTQVMIDHQLSGAAFLQYNSAADAVIANLRLRYNPREGTDLYIVYNEGLDTDRYRFSPVAPTSTGRTLLVKYSRAFDLELF